ncbi:hypothetical protein Tco_0831315 [Tanacetum coccineum]
MDSEKEAQKSGKRLKRVAGSYTTQKSPKKPKVMKSAKNVTEEEAAEYEKEKEVLRLSLKIISGNDSEVNYEPLSRRFPIVNWEYKLLGNVDVKDIYVYKLTRADGSSSYHGDMQAFLRRLDRQDLNDLYMMLFNPDEKDELWMNQLDWKLLKWKLHENCRVHTLFMDGIPMEINMLVEKKYPLIKELLEKVLNLQLEAEKEIFHMAQQIIPAAQLIVSKVPDTKDTIMFKLDSQEIIYTVDMFRDTLYLLVETPDNPFIAPVNINVIESFMQKVGYQGVVDKVSAFNTKFLAQPWQTMFKVFNRCLTTRTSGHDQTKINILQLFHVVVNRTNVDYTALLWWDFIYCVQ